ncbi:MAG: hypothetical protein U1F98_09015 [Verrucomicrobiota bacterium]
MKLSKTLAPVIAGTLFVGAAQAQVNLTITGSTAFRSITFDRAASLYDAGSISTNGNTGNGPGTFSGTMSNAIPSLGSTPVVLRMSFSGSATGMAAVDNGTPVPTVQPGTGVTTNLAPDIALSDVYPESATPTIDGSHFDQFIVGVIPFLFVKNTLPNSSLITATNITREQAQLLFSASGAMPASYLGGSSAAPVYLTGRDSGSGTRITTQMVIGFTGDPTLWVTNGISSALYSTNEGFASGGTERSLVANYTNVVGYLGVSDARAIASTTSWLAYEGVQFTPAEVQNGNYPLWGYEHFVSKKTLTSNQQAVRNALVSAITNQVYQTTSSAYTNSFVDQNNMKVERGADGGPITSLTF